MCLFSDFAFGGKRLSSVPSVQAIKGTRDSQMCGCISVVFAASVVAVG